MNAADVARKQTSWLAGRDFCDPDWCHAWRSAQRFDQSVAIPSSIDRQI